jgi:hypothetical protein
MSTSIDSWVQIYERRESWRFDRRIGTRVAVDGQTVKWRRVPARRALRRPLRPATVAHVSVTGVAIIASALLETGSVIELEHEGGRALAQVRWSMKPDGEHPRYGCAFLSLDEAFEAWVHAVTAPDMSIADAWEPTQDNGPHFGEGRVEAVDDRAARLRRTALRVCTARDEGTA